MTEEPARPTPDVEIIFTLTGSQLHAEAHLADRAVNEDAATRERIRQVLEKHGSPLMHAVLRAAGLPAPQTASDNERQHR